MYSVEVEGGKCICESSSFAEAIVMKPGLSALYEATVSLQVYEARHHHSEMILSLLPIRSLIKINMADDSIAGVPVVL